MAGVAPQSRAALVDFTFLARGFLPLAGGYMDQPARLMVQALIIEDAINQHEREET